MSDRDENGQNPVGRRPEAQARAAGFSLRRLWPIAVLLLGLAAFFAFGLDDYVTCAALAEHREGLNAFVARHGLWAPMVYMALYAGAVALSLPGGAVLSVAGGFLFGVVLGAGMAVVSATLGATVLFIIAKSALGDTLRAKAGPWMTRMAEGFQENALSYLLVLRLVPLFPFWLVNLVPAFLGVPLGIFVLGTFVGIIPGAFVFNLFGAGLGSIFDAGGECTLEGIVTPQIVAALIGLAALAITPVVYKRLKDRRS